MAGRAPEVIQNVAWVVFAFIFFAGIRAPNCT